MGERDGVAFYDDSKGTNPGATMKAIEGFADGTVHLILGGRNKDADLPTLTPMVRRKARRAYLIGEAADGIRARRSATRVPFERVRDPRPRRARRRRRRRGRARPSCSRRPARASTSSGTSITAATSSRSWSASISSTEGPMAKKLAFDKVLFTIVVLLMFFGLVMVYLGERGAGARAAASTTSCQAGGRGRPRPGADGLPDALGLPPPAQPGGRSTRCSARCCCCSSACSSRRSSTPPAAGSSSAASRSSPRSWRSWR